MNTTPDPLAAARRADSTARSQRVLTALDQLAASGGDLSVSAVARSARVHRSFIYRHDDLHAAVTDRAAAAAATTDTDTATVSRQSLRAELANATERNRRQAQHIAQLERRLSEALGQTVWQETGLGAPPDLDTLQRHNTHLEQQLAELRGKLADRQDELDAARSTNRELMTRLNRADAAVQRG